VRRGAGASEGRIQQVNHDENAYRYVRIDLPGSIVRGLWDGGAFDNSSWIDRVTRLSLQRADYFQRGPRSGETAGMLLPYAAALNLAGYFRDHADDYQGTLGTYDRFGFTRKQAGKLADRIERQLNDPKYLNPSTPLEFYESLGRLKNPLPEK
jgi:hypothetical protein